MDLLTMKMSIAAQSQREIRSSLFFVLDYSDFSWTLKIFKNFTLKHIGN